MSSRARCSQIAVIMCHCMGVMATLALLYGLAVLVVRSHALSEGILYNLAGELRIEILCNLLNLVFPMGIPLVVISVWQGVWQRRKFRYLVLLNSILFLVLAGLLVAYGYSWFAEWYPGFSFGERIWWLP